MTLTPATEKPTQATLRPATAPIYPASADLQAFWDACAPLTSPAAGAASAYLERRGIDPKVVAACDLARALPRGAAHPAWARTRTTPEREGRVWHDVGVRLVVPLVDASGRMVSVVGRLLETKRDLKTLVPLDLSSSGLCFASLLDREWLARMDMASIDADVDAPRPPDNILVVEGEMDYLTWATRLLSRTPTPPPIGDKRAPFPGYTLLVGVRAGSFGPAWAGALRGLTTDAPRPVVIRTHHDGAGNAYALKIGMHLRNEGFTVINRTIPYASDAPDLEAKAQGWDENDAARFTVLPSDPLAGSLDFTGSLTVPGASPAAARGQVLSEEEVLEIHRLRSEAAGLADKARTTPELEEVLVQRRKYFDAACASAASNVATAPHGDRNNTLFREAAALTRFRFEPDLVVSRATLNEVLLGPARAVGHDEARIKATLDSAWRRDFAARYAPPMPETLSLDEEVRRRARAARDAKGSKGKGKGKAGAPPLPRAQKTKRAAQGEGVAPDPLATSDGIALSVDDDGVVDEGALLPEELAQVEAEVQAAAASPRVGSFGGRYRLNLGLPLYSLEEALYRATAQMPNIYARDGVLVETVPPTGDRPAHLRSLPPERLDVELSRYVEWYRVKRDKSGRDVEVTVSDPPARYVRAMVASRLHPGVRTIRHVVSHPCAIDGLLLLREGYDAQAQALYLPQHPVSVPPVLTAPSKEDAAGALEVLKDVFSEFVFEHSGGLGAALSLLLTQLGRPDIVPEFVPYYLVTATTPGTGKGTLVEAINGIITGDCGLHPTQPATGDEERKQLLSWALEGRTGIVYYDNIRSGGSVGSPALDSLLTAGGRIEARKLGGNETHIGSMSVTFVGTGNNVSITGDLSRRMVPISLTTPPGVRPSDRTFSRDLRAFVLANRPRLLHAAFTIMAAYRAAGRPLDGQLSDYPSFARWSRLARNPLVWLGMPDFVRESRELAKGADLQVVYLEDMLRCLYVLSKGRPFTAPELQRYWKHAADDTDCAISQGLVAACEQLDFSDSGRWNKARVNATLAAYQGRALEQYRLRPVQPFVSWKVEPL